MIYKLQKFISEYATVFKNNFNKIPLDKTTKIALSCLVGSVALVYGIYRLIGRIAPAKPEEKTPVFSDLITRCEKEWMNFLYDKGGLLAVAKNLHDKHNTAEAVKYYTFLAEKGVVEAQYELGEIYLKNWEGVSQDFVKAEKYLIDATNNNHLEACQVLIYFYNHMKKDPDKALEYSQKAAEKGVAAVQMALGLHYLSEAKKVKDPKEREIHEVKAMSLFLAANGKKQTGASYQIGLLVEKGYGGTPADLERALGFFKLAAKEGDSEAQYKVGCAYDRGFGVDSDIGKAVKYYDLAVARKHAGAKDRLLELEITPLSPQRTPKTTKKHNDLGSV